MKPTTGKFNKIDKSLARLKRKKREDNILLL